MESKMDKKEYTPHVLRSHPFRWINFPLIATLWFILYWFLLCPIVWFTFAHSLPYSHKWTSLLITMFIIIFIILMIALTAIWRCLDVKNTKKYDHVLMNPEYGDIKEYLCADCKNFHPVGKKCVEFVKNQPICCNRCGNCKESFNKCCEKKKAMRGPSYDIVLKKPQPNFKTEKHEMDVDEKRIKTFADAVVLSINEPKSNNYKDKQDATNFEEKARPDVVPRTKSKRPNLKPVDVELANRQSNVEFFGEKIALKPKTETSIVKIEETRTSVGAPLKTGSVSSMEPMSKQKFNDYHHIVQINTPMTPEEIEEQNRKLPKSPISPRELFFYDLIQKANKIDSGNSSDSTHFQFEKKRPTSYILMTSDVDPSKQTEAEANALKRFTMGPISSMKGNQDEAVWIKRDENVKKRNKSDGERKHGRVSKEVTEPTEKIVTTVRILRTVKKSSPEADALMNPHFFNEKKFNKQDSTLSEQSSVKDFQNLKRESVSKYFGGDLYRGPDSPLKPARTLSGHKGEDGGRTGSIHEATHICDEPIQETSVDDVFSD